MLETSSASELAQWIDRRRLLQRIGATVGVAGFAAILAPSLSVSAYAATGGSGRLAQGADAPAASLAGSSAADGGALTMSPGTAGAAGDASSLPSSSLDNSGSGDAAGAGASSLPSSSPDDSGSAGAGAASGAAQAPSAGWATLTELGRPHTNYDD